MGNKKAKFSIFMIIGIIAFICSSAVYASTGGISDWIVHDIQDGDKNNNGYLDSSEQNDNNLKDNYYDGYYDNNGGFDSNSGFDIFNFFSNQFSNNYDSNGGSDFLANILKGYIN